MNIVLKISLLFGLFFVSACDLTKSGKNVDNNVIKQENIDNNKPQVYTSCEQVTLLQYCENPNIVKGKLCELNRAKTLCVESVLSLKEKEVMKAFKDYADSKITLPALINKYNELTPEEKKKFYVTYEDNNAAHYLMKKDLTKEANEFLNKIIDNLAKENKDKLVHKYGKDNKSLIQVAESKNNDKLVEDLIAKGADINDLTIANVEKNWSKIDKSKLSEQVVKEVANTTFAKNISEITNMANDLPIEKKDIFTQALSVKSLEEVKEKGGDQEAVKLNEILKLNSDPLKAFSQLKNKLNNNNIVNQINSITNGIINAPDEKQKLYEDLKVAGVDPLKALTATGAKDDVLLFNVDLEKKRFADALLKLNALSNEDVEKALIVYNKNTLNSLVKQTIDNKEKLDLAKILIDKASAADYADGALNYLLKSISSGFSTGWPIEEEKELLIYILGRSDLFSVDKKYDSLVDFSLKCINDDKIFFEILYKEYSKDVLLKVAARKFSGNKPKIDTVKKLLGKTDEWNTIACADLMGIEKYHSECDNVQFDDLKSAIERNHKDLLDMLQKYVTDRDDFVAEYMKKTPKEYGELIELVLNNIDNKFGENYFNSIDNNKTGKAPLLKRAAIKFSGNKPKIDTVKKLLGKTDEWNTIACADLMGIEKYHARCEIINAKDVAMAMHDNPKFVLEEVKAMLDEATKSQSLKDFIDEYVKINDMPGVDIGIFDIINLFTNNNIKNIKNWDDECEKFAITDEDRIKYLCNVDVKFVVDKNFNDEVLSAFNKINFSDRFIELWDSYSKHVINAFKDNPVTPTMYMLFENMITCNNFLGNIDLFDALLSNIHDKNNYFDYIMKFIVKYQPEVSVKNFAKWAYLNNEINLFREIFYDFKDESKLFLLQGLEDKLAEAYRKRFFSMTDLFAITYSNELEKIIGQIARNINTVEEISLRWNSELYKENNFHLSFLFEQLYSNLFNMNEIFIYIIRHFNLEAKSLVMFKKFRGLYLNKKDIDSVYNSVMSEYNSSTLFEDIYREKMRNYLYDMAEGALPPH